MLDVTHRSEGGDLGYCDSKSTVELSSTNITYDGGLYDRRNIKIWWS